MTTEPPLESQATTRDGTTDDQPKPQSDEPPRIEGTLVRPSRRRAIGPYLVAEIAIYVLVAAMLIAFIVVNIVVAYFGGGTELVSRFAADGDFLLAAAAVLVIAFEIRKESRKHSD